MFISFIHLATILNLATATAASSDGSMIRGGDISTNENQRHLGKSCNSVVGTACGGSDGKCCDPLECSIEGACEAPATLEPAPTPEPTSGPTTKFPTDPALPGLCSNTGSQCSTVDDCNCGSSGATRLLKGSSPRLLKKGGGGNSKETSSPTTANPTMSPVTSSPTACECRIPEPDGICQANRDSPIADTYCMCGVCTECAPWDTSCGANCQFLGNRENSNTFVARPPPSLLLSVPCQYTNLTLTVANCAPMTFYRDEAGYFNITKKLELVNGNWVNPACGLGSALNPRVIFDGYGSPPYDADTALPSVSPQCGTEFCQDDGQFEIHTSCSYPLYVGQKYGPQQDIIVAGYCLGPPPFAKCTYAEEDPYNCAAV